MSDDKKIIVISGNNSEGYEFRHWPKKYGVSFDQLKRVVKDVGAIAKDVDDFLKKRNKK